MPKYAQFDPATPEPKPIIGWYDTDEFDYPNLPPPASLLELTLEQWDGRLSTPFVQSGQLIAPPAPTAAQLLSAQIAVGTQKVQYHLDEIARSRGYDNIVSACSYAGAANPFQAESKAFITWRGAVWTKCYEMMSACQAGTSPIPTEAELIAALPVFAG